MQYEIRVRGHLGTAVLESFEGLEPHVDSCDTLLQGPVEDQAALHGLLQRIESMGLELIEVRRLSDS